MIIVKYIWKTEEINKNYRENPDIFRRILTITYWEGYFLFGFIPLYIKQTEKVY